MPIHKTFHRLAPALLLALLFSAAPSRADTSATVTPLRPGIWTAQVSGGNVTIASGPQGTLLIDTDMEATAPVLADAISKLGLGAPRWVLNTHFHYDHTGGNALFSRGATLIATPALRERLQTPQRLWRADHAARPPEAWPVLALLGEMTLHLGPEPVRLLPLAGGHTDGDAIAIFPRAGVAAVGDMVFGGMFPIVHPEHGGSLLTLRRQLGWLHTQLKEGDLIVPGHGPVINRAQLKDYLDMLDASLAHVRAGRAAGKSLEQLQALPLPAICEPYGNGYVKPAQWLATVFAAVGLPDRS